MTPQTIETIRNTLEDAVETRGYELSSALHDVRDQTSRLARQTQVKGPVSGGLVTRMRATLEKNATPSTAVTWSAGRLPLMVGMKRDKKVQNHESQNRLSNLGN